MGFNDDILKLTGGKGFKGIDAKGDKVDVEKTATLGETGKKSPDTSSSDKWSSELGNPDYDYVIESDLVTPVLKAVKDENAKPLIVVVDDDFETLDLIEIYLKRDYTYEGFSGPREAVFYLNQHHPEIVFIDCKIHTMKAMTFVEIIRKIAGNEDVQFVLIGTEEELELFDLDYLPNYVIGTISKPIARGKLQYFIDKVTNKSKPE